MTEVTAAADKKRTFHTLDAMRGVAAILIVSRHSFELFGGLFPESYLAVDLFFVMSGVVVANAYEARLRAGLSGGRFVLIRAVRLYPLYALGLSVAIVQAVAAGVAHHTLDIPRTLLNVAFALFMLLGPYNGPRWSLFYEGVVNIVYGLIIKLLSNVLLIAIILLGAAGVVLTQLVYGTLDVGWLWSTSWVGFARVAYSFFLGVALWRFLKIQPIQAPFGAWAAVGVTILMLVVSPPPGLKPFYELAVVLLGFPFLVQMAMRADVGRKIQPVFSFLGLTSYAIYVLHQPCALIFTGLLTHVGHRNPAELRPYAGIAFIMGMILVSYLADRYFDAPVRAYLQARISPRGSIPGRKTSFPLAGRTG